MPFHSSVSVMFLLLSVSIEFFLHYITLSSVLVPHMRVKIFMCPILVGSLTISGTAHLTCDYWISKLLQKQASLHLDAMGEKYVMCLVDLTFCHLLNINYLVLLIDIVLQWKQPSIATKWLHSLLNSCKHQLICTLNRHCPVVEAAKYSYKPTKIVASFSKFLCSYGMRENHYALSCESAFSLNI